MFSLEMIKTALTAVVVSRWGGQQEEHPARKKLSDGGAGVVICLR